MKANQRVMLTKRLLKEGLFRLMETKSIDKISVSELCREAGINRTTFYLHYEIPKDILKEIEKELISHFPFDEMRISGMQDVLVYAQQILNIMYDHAQELKILICNHSDDEFAHVIDEFCALMLKMRGSVPGMEHFDEESMQLMSAYTVGGTYYLLKQWLVEGVKKTPKEISELILKLMDVGERLRGGEK